MNRSEKACVSAAILLMSSCCASDSEILEACEKFQKSGEPVYLETLGLREYDKIQIIRHLKKTKYPFIGECHQLVKNFL